MSETQTREPQRSLGLLDATMVGMGAMIGAGIFVLTGLAAQISGPAAILVFALNGVVTSFTALSYAELAAAIPESGGGYAFVKEVFSESVSFLMGWMLWFAYMIAGALYAIGFGANFVEFLEVFGVHVPDAVEVVGVAVPVGASALGLLVVVVLVGLNAASTSASGGAETVVTIVKIIVLLVFAGFGAFAASVGNFDPFFTQSAISVLPAMALTFIAFEGYDLIATVTEEVKNPKETIPKAIFYSLAATIAIYLLVVFVAIGTRGAASLEGEAAIAVAAEGFMPAIPVVGLGGASIIAFGAVFSTVSALNAVVLASSRVAFAMGRQDQLPGGVGRIHPRFGTPLRAVLVSAVVMVLGVTFLSGGGQAGRLSSLFFLLSFVVVNGSAIKLRRERPDMTRPYEMPFYPVPPVLGIVLNLLLGVFIDPFIWAVGVAWLALGGLVYLVLGR
jgi:amino acid transporter